MLHVGGRVQTVAASVSLESGGGLGENTALGVLCVWTCGVYIQKLGGVCGQDVGWGLQCRGSGVRGVVGARRRGPARWWVTAGLRLTRFLDPCAGVTTCVSLSWASSRASGGPWRSSAGSVTEPSVSCCRPSTFPTCTACGKPGPPHGSAPAGRAFPCPVCVGVQGDRAQPRGTSLLAEAVGPFRSNGKYCQMRRRLQGAGLARTKRPNCVCFGSAVPYLWLLY